MAMFALAIPILPGKTDAWRAFIGELNGARRAEFVESRKQLGVRERTFFQPTPMGDFVVVTLEGDDPAGAFARFGQLASPFGDWFKAAVTDIHGVDLAAPPPGPMPEQVVDSGS
jgi:hypothetical protein